MLRAACGICNSLFCYEKSTECNIRCPEALAPGRMGPVILTHHPEAAVKPSVLAACQAQHDSQVRVMPYLCFQWSLKYWKKSRKV